MKNRDIEIADYLAKEGHSFSIELHDYNHGYFQNLTESYFAIASAIALCWTGHAKFESAFVEYASAFIDGKIAKDNTIAAKFCKRFGFDDLDSAMTNFRAYYRKVRHLMPNFNSCSVQDINRLQQRLLSQLNDLRDKGQVSGIGPWLFLGPFKIILGDQQRLWDIDGINAIVLPTGIEVDRGIIRLIREGYTFMNDFDPHWLEETTGSLLDNYATCSMVHTHIIKVAELAKTSALHVNSALYQYGRQDI
ncbi:MAG: hypothetical protein WC150_08430 [Bacteroidia bacterium]